MSNIPFNTVASVLVTGNVQQQVAQAIDRKTQAATRSERLLSQQNQRHAEEIEDPGEKSLEAIGEDNRGQSEQQRKKNSKRQAAAEVDIAGVAAAAAPAGDPTNPSTGALDISA